ncbi:MAG: alkaline phosphatase [Marinilabiliaceae bacterium]|jgi:alkaline phosphatase|nr:alkaline phosphatase [Marinilabiliaceae bacterium]
MNKLFLRLNTYALLIFLILSGCSSDAYRHGSEEKVKNVVLIIGDGMGLAHLYSAMSLYQGTLNIESARNIGFVKTHSADNYATDSAASGTAMATGKKTRNGMIGLLPDSTVTENLTELLHKNERASGVVSTSAVTHATPASFVAHNINRNNYYEIAEDFLLTQPDVFIGGGLKYFNKRPDNRDLIKDLRKNRYNVVLSIEDLLEVNSVKLAALLSEEHMPQISEGRGDMLSYGALKAIETLSKNRNGFFLMIEASQIDWAAHSHDTRYIIEETIDLDRTLGVVLDYARRLGNTLVIVTADHETGGMTIVKGDNNKESIVAEYSVGGHTGLAVPIYSFGPGASQFTGFLDNTEIFNRIVKVMALDENGVTDSKKK